MQDIRVRFAPSPTGPLHIGGVRTALYNYLFARKWHGTMILRIEDTDRNRFVPGAEDYIIESLNWAGIEYDEGPGKEGNYGPYRQSERKEIYRKYAEELIENGHAYYAFDTPEELEQMRENLKQEGSSTQQYDSRTRILMRNSLTLQEEEVERLLEAGEPYAIRLKVPENEKIVVDDLIRHRVTFDSSQVDDKVLLKPDGMPTYHLANVVDDHLMKITHVIRGEEWLPSTPLHVLLYKFFGWQDEMPRFAHMPLTLKPDGKGKLSKRDGDRLGFPVFPLNWKNPKTGETSAGYRESGYYPEAFINILAFLGWNPGTEQEIFSMDELVQAFSIDRIGKAGSRFDPEKARWYNHQYLVKKPDEELADQFIKFLKDKGIEAEKDMVISVVSLIKERADFVKDFWEQGSFFFETPAEYDEKTIRKKWKPETPQILDEFAQRIEKTEPFDKPALDVSVKEFIQEKGIGMGQLMNVLRLSLVGSGKGPGLTDIMAVLGKDETISRIRRAIETIGDGQKTI